MKAKQTYLKGKSVFIVSLFVIVVTVLTVYLTGRSFNRSLETNFYISLGIISTSLLLFIFYGLYQGIGLLDNFPRKYKSRNLISKIDIIPEIPSVDAGEGIGGLILSIVLWLGMSILFVVLLFFFEAILLFATFIVMGMLYWVFFRALKFVFKKSRDTQHDLFKSAIYALAYTTIYVGWLFGVVYLTELI